MIKCDCEPSSTCTCASSVVCLKNVSFERGLKRVLDDVTFCLDEGTFLGIIGPNGGGKTTLLRLILGTLTPAAGTIRVFGHHPTQGAAARRDRPSIGYVPQRHEIDKNFPATALDVVLMGASARAGLFRRTPADAHDRAVELLQRVGLSELVHRPIGRMSGGQQQRCFIARALITQPRLIVLDEPTVGLDSASQVRFLDLIRRLQRELGLTIMMVSHDIGQLAHYADQIACLNRHGQLHWHDSANLLTDHILHHLYEVDAGITDHVPHSTNCGCASPDDACEADAYSDRIRTQTAAH